MTDPQGDPEANRPTPTRQYSVYEKVTTRPHEHAFSHADEAGQVISLAGTLLSNTASVAGIAKDDQTDIATAGAAVALVADAGKLADIISRWREIGRSPRVTIHAASVAANAAGQLLKIYADRRAADEGENVSDLTKRLQISAVAVTAASAMAMIASKPDEAHATLGDRDRGTEMNIMGGDTTASPEQLSDAGSARSQAANGPLPTAGRVAKAATPDRERSYVVQPSGARTASPVRR